MSKSHLIWMQSSLSPIIYITLRYPRDMTKKQKKNQRLPYIYMLKLNANHRITSESLAVTKPLGVNSITKVSLRNDSIG